MRRAAPAGVWGRAPPSPDKGGERKLEAEFRIVELVAFQKAGAAAVGADAAHLVIDAQDAFRTAFQLEIMLLCRELLLRVMQKLEAERFFRRDAPSGCAILYERVLTVPMAAGVLRLVVILKIPIGCGMEFAQDA